MLKVLIDPPSMGREEEGDQVKKKNIKASNTHRQVCEHCTYPHIDMIDKKYTKVPQSLL